MFLKVAVCDDDERERSSVRDFCGREIERLSDCQVQVYAFADGQELLYSEIDFDILILDIEMKKIDGIRVKNEFAFKYERTKIIFLTSHSELMSEAFGKNVYGFVDKLKKPKERLSELLKQTIRDWYKEKEQIIIFENNKMVKLYLREIVYIKSSDVYLEVYTVRNEIYVIRNSMKKFLEEYGRVGFYRVHKSYSVNLKYVEEITSNKIIMNLAEKEKQLKLPISRGKSKEIKRVHLDYISNM